VAHGFLTLSLAPFLNAEALPRLLGLLVSIVSKVMKLILSLLVALVGVKMGVNYGLNKVRFIAPVHVGAKIRTRVVLKEIAEVPGGIQVVIESTFEVQEKVGEPIHIFSIMRE